MDFIVGYGGGGGFNTEAKSVLRKHAMHLMFQKHGKAALFGNIRNMLSLWTGEGLPYSNPVKQMKLQNTLLRPNFALNTHYLIAVNLKTDSQIKFLNEPCFSFTLSISFGNHTAIPNLTNITFSNLL